MSLLSYEDWVRKHARRLRGVSKSEKRRRYDQYRRTESDDAADGGRTVTHARHVRTSAADPLSRVQERVTVGIKEHDFICALMDPFNSPPARVPEPDPRQTAVSSIKFTVPIFSTKCPDGVGRAAFILRPAIDACFAASSTDSDLKANVHNGEGPPDLMRSCLEADASWAGQGFPDYSILPSHSMEWTVGRMESIPGGKADLLRNLYTRYRVTAAGAKFTYSNKIIEARGDLCVANLPGTYNLPSAYNYAFTMTSTPGAELLPAGAGLEYFNCDGFDYAQMIGLDFETLQTIEGARTGPAIHGAESVWVPNWDVLSKFRPTRYYPTSLNPAAAVQFSGTDIANAAAAAALLSSNATIPLPVACADDPDAYTAYFNGVYNRNNYAIATFNGANEQVAPFNRGFLLQGPGGGSTIAATGAANAVTLRDALITNNHAYANTMMAPGDEAICFIFDGVPLSDDGSTGTEIGLMEVVIHLEGTVNSRTLSLEGDDKSQLVAHAPHQAQLAKVATHVVPRVVMGEDVADGQKPGAVRATETVHKVMDGVHHAVKAAPGIIQKGKDIFEAALPVLEGLGLAGLF